MIKWGKVRTYFKENTYKDFESVDLGTVEIDEYDYLRFKRLISTSKWATVTMDLENVIYFETEED